MAGNFLFMHNKKYAAEVEFWKREIKNYVSWYLGDLKMHYSTISPREDQKVRTFVLSHSAILTWLKLHQEVKYLKDLMLDKAVFAGLSVLDVGSGPMPSALVFDSCELYCLDPLIDEYIKIGFPLHYYKGVQFICGLSEGMPLEDNFFDVVISVNAIDHVDNIYKTSSEIERVLKPRGKLIIHVHYHKGTDAEPLELNDDIMSKAFFWCDGLKKIKKSKQKSGALAGAGEYYVLWSNF